MHIVEGAMSSFPAWSAFIGRSYSDGSGASHEIAATDQMWNAGAVDLNAADAGLLRDAMAAHDSLPAQGLPRGLVEQVGRRRSSRNAYVSPERTTSSITTGERRSAHAGNLFWR